MDDHSVDRRAGDHHGADAQAGRRGPVVLVDHADQGDPGTGGELLHDAVEGGLVGRGAGSRRSRPGRPRRARRPARPRPYDGGVVAQTRRLRPLPSPRMPTIATTRAPARRASCAGDGADAAGRGGADHHGRAGRGTQVAHVRGVRREAGHAERTQGGRSAGGRAAPTPGAGRPESTTASERQPVSASTRLPGLDVRAARLDDLADAASGGTSPIRARAGSGSSKSGRYRDPHLAHRRAPSERPRRRRSPPASGALGIRARPTSPSAKSSRDGRSDGSPDQGHGLPPRRVTVDRSAGRAGTGSARPARR